MRDVPIVRVSVLVAVDDRPEILPRNVGSVEARHAPVEAHVVATAVAVKGHVHRSPGTLSQIHIVTVGAAGCVNVADDRTGHLHVDDAIHPASEVV